MIINMIFKKRGHVIILTRDKEPIEWFVNRGYFVVSQFPNSIEEYNNAVTYSRIYVNKKYKKCGYSEKIEKRLRNMTKNMFDEV